MFKRIFVMLILIGLVVALYSGFRYWQSRQPVQNGQVWVKVVNYGYIPDDITLDPQSKPADGVVEFVSFADTYGNIYNLYFSVGDDKTKYETADRTKQFLITVIRGQVIQIKG